MSDIFISYAKADHALAPKLSAFLDVAHLYRDEIMKQLAAARAVITMRLFTKVESIM
jgi:hypothetical protein